MLEELKGLTCGMSYSNEVIKEVIGWWWDSFAYELLSDILKWEILNLSHLRFSFISKFQSYDMWCLTSIKTEKVNW